jgi:hypothetical protein
MAQISKYKKPVASDSCCWFSLLLFLVSGFLVDFVDNALFNKFPLLSYSVVSKFQNEFMKSSFLPKHEQLIILRISALYGTEILTMHCNAWFIFWEK